MRLAILSANLGGFDKPVVSVPQVTKDIDLFTYDFNDNNFPPITGLSGRFQYRIPKLFGLEMLPDEFPKMDIVIWYDAAMSLIDENAVMWFIEQLGDANIAIFKHPWRNSVQEEVDHIEEKLKEGNGYITSRYKNGLHKEMLDVMKRDGGYRDNWLFASTTFIYRNSPIVQKLMREWWFYQSRYYTCDQVALPYAMYKTGIDVNIIDEHVFRNKYIGVTSKHK